MRNDIGDKMVKRGLFSALVKTREKCPVLFLVFILSLFFVNGVRAESIPISDEQNSKTITVRASVPLTPEFVFSIQKNSSITLEKSVFALDEEVQARVKIVGGNNFSLRGHRVDLQILNERELAFAGEPVLAGEKILFILSGETDNDGIADFSFSADERLLGAHTLRVVDITYGEPIVISEEKTFIVYKQADGKRERELTEQKIIIGESPVPKQIPSGEAPKIFASADILQNNGTIKGDFKKEIKQKWSNDP